MSASGGEPVGVGEAGQRGDDVRSDLWVRVELHDGGGVDISLQSKVGAYYGETIRSQLELACKALGVSHAHIEVVDRGALPYAIAARLECAVRRAGWDGKEALPERIGVAPASVRERLRRSRLYLPGNEPKFMINAALHGADAVILDLEDSVAAHEKDAARLLVRNALRSVSFGDAERMVRINPGEHGLADLDAVVPHAPNLILIPKCESIEDVQRVDERVQSLRKSADLDADVWIMPILETALGIERAYEIGRASSNVVALTIGLEDYTADLGVERTSAGTESLYARMALVNAARAAGVQAIDSVFSDVGDADGLRRSTLEAKGLGFEGKGCIHPRQIGIVHEAFAPTEVEIRRAQRVVLAFEDATEKNLGVVALGTKMIDPPVVKRAQRTVELAVQLGRLAENWRGES
jgi:citrate lyase subunit beta/citryl-CoA lyase